MGALFSKNVFNKSLSLLQLLIIKNKTCIKNFYLKMVKIIALTYDRCTVTVFIDELVSSADINQ